MPTGNGDDAPPNDDATPVAVNGDLSVRAINAGSLKAVTQLHGDRAYTALSGTAITYLRAVQQAEGDLIAWQRVGGGVNGTVTMPVTSPDKIESLVSENWAPDWSPDGRKLVLTGLWISGYDGGGGSLGVNGMVPAWSADNKFICYNRSDGDNEIYRMELATSAETKLTSNTADDDHASISPDCTKTAFQTTEGGDFEIAVQNATGTNSGRVLITNNVATDLQPDWSPDGRRIVFCSDRDGDYEIYTMDPDGGNAAQLTVNSVPDSDPSWSPDGTKIVFVSRRDDAVYGELYTMMANGSNVVRLTNNTGVDELDPEWSPKTLAHIRIYVGSAGTDRGFNPPFGSSIDAAILVRATSPSTPPDTDCVALDVAAGQTVTLTRLPQDGVVYEATATGNFLNVWENRQAGTPPVAWIASSGAPISGNTVRNLVLIFDPKYSPGLTTLIPLPASRKPLGRVERDGDNLTWIPAQ